MGYDLNHHNWLNLIPLLVISKKHVPWLVTTCSLLKHLDYILYVHLFLLNCWVFRLFHDKHRSLSSCTAAYFGTVRCMICLPCLTNFYGGELGVWERHQEHHSISTQRCTAPQYLSHSFFDDCTFLSSLLQYVLRLLNFLFISSAVENKMLKQVNTLIETVKV